MDLNIAQKITHTLTTESIQHLEVLQYSNMDLAQFIYEKATENPLLTVVEKNMNHVKDLVDLAKTSYTSKTSNKKLDDFMQVQFVQKDTHHQYLLEQIPAQQSVSQQDKKILEYLIYHIDERFFLTIEIEDVAHKFNVSEKYIESILQLLQKFEPVGVGSRDVKEYLLLQIAEDLNAPKHASSFVQNHLVDIADFSIKHLSKLYNISIDDTKKTIAYIKCLKPYPPAMATSTKMDFIIPDVEVIKLGGEWVVEMNNQTFPKVTINQIYVDLLKSTIEYEAYYQSCMKDALLLIQGIEDRQKTLYRVIRLLLDLQASFFERGMRGLKPMRLIDVAEVLKIHESTVSRTIRNKYIRTPHGIFSIKALFNKGISNEFGTLNSVMHIKSLIKKLIEKENKQKPLSDQQLTSLLMEEDIQISRRTVAKYREEMDIKNSSKRIYF